MPILIEQKEIKIDPDIWNIKLLNRIDEINKEYPKLSIQLGNWKGLIDDKGNYYYVWSLKIERMIDIQTENLIKELFQEISVNISRFNPNIQDPFASLYATVDFKSEFNRVKNIQKFKDFIKENTKNGTILKICIAIIFLIFISRNLFF